MPRRFDFWGLVALIAEEISNLAGHSRHDGAVEESIKTGKQECADDDGDEDFYAGIDIALCLVGHNCGLNLDRCGIDLILDFLEHIFYLLTFLFLFLFVFDYRNNADCHNDNDNGNNSHHSGGVDCLR